MVSVQRYLPHFANIHCLWTYYSYIFSLFSGFVVLIIDNDGDAELYSPEGQCNYKLARTPIQQYNPVLVYANNRIIACSRGTSCWEYNVIEDLWLNFAAAPFLAEQQPGQSLNNHLYVTDMSNTHVMDLVSNTWSQLPGPPIFPGNAPVLVGWRDSFILLGGGIYPRLVQTFNVTSQSWAVTNSTDSPIEMFWSSSVLIGPDEVLIVGSWSSGFFHSAAKYYPITNSWVRLEDSQVNHCGSRLVKLGSRIFAIDGYETDTVEEFFATNNTWTLIGIKLINSYQGHHSVVALPSALFAHLPGGCKGVF